MIVILTGVIVTRQIGRILVSPELKMFSKIIFYSKEKSGWYLWKENCTNRLAWGLGPGQSRSPPPPNTSFWFVEGVTDVTQNHRKLCDVAFLHLMAPMDYWQNSTQVLVKQFSVRQKLAKMTRPNTFDLSLVSSLNKHWHELSAFQSVGIRAVNWQWH